MSDDEVAMLLSSLRDTQGLKSLVVTKNGFGKHSFHAITKLLESDEALRDLKTLVIKDIV